MKRFFNPSEKAAIYNLYGGRCARCGDEVTGSGHADHTVAHANGGSTTLSNAQLLCHSCNTSKGAKAADFKPLFEVRKPKLTQKLHSWQADCLAAQLEVIKQGGKSYFVAAGVGSGKSCLSLATYLEGDFDLIIVITPKSGIRGSWQADAAKMGIKLRTIVSSSSFRGNDGSGSRYEIPNGFVLNVSMVGSVMNELMMYCKNFKVMVAFDEAHHYGEDMQWTNNVLEAFEDAKYKVGLSGTPFRADNKRIAFLGYSKRGNKSIATPQYVYPYEKAFADGLVAPIITRCVGGSVTKIDIDSGLSTKFDYADGDYSSITGEPDPGRMSARLRLSAVESYEWQLALVEAARSQLHEYRKDGIKWGGLIVCYTIEQAQHLAKLIRSKWGDKCLEVFADADTEISVAQFNADHSFDWVISITKVSEGITIPRLRTCALLTSVTTRNNFDQLRGRIARLFGGMNHLLQEGSFFIPSDPRLIAYAEESNQIMLHEVSWFASDDPQEAAVLHGQCLQINNALAGEQSEVSVLEAISDLKEKFKKDLKRNEINGGDYVLYAEPKFDGAVIGEAYYSEEEYRKIRQSLDRKGVDHFTILKSGRGLLSYFDVSFI